MIVRNSRVVSRSFTTILKRKPKRCTVCNKIIQVGEPVFLEQEVVEKIYPVKGIMKYSRWHGTHPHCIEEE